MCVFACVCACLRGIVIVPNMMPLGFVGGCQTTLMDDNRTSGNTILTGGPGTGEKNREGSWQQKDNDIQGERQNTHKRTPSILS